GFHDGLAAATASLCEGMEAAARDAGVPLTTTRVGAMFGLFFTDQQVDTYAQAVACDTAAFNRFFHAMLDLIQTPGFYAEIERKTRLLTDGLRAMAVEAGVAMTTNHVCGMFGIFFTDQTVETFDQATACDTALFNRFFHGMLQRGVYLAPSAFEAGFLSSAHNDDLIGETLVAARDALRAARAG
ncbi:MAG TPA: hypothetical protein VM847_00845, partial [Tahibacter sp.]|nr:hypothetical protein [Tahibacter sp.]